MQPETMDRVRVVIADAVRWTDAGAIQRTLAEFPSTTIVFHGDSPGVIGLLGRLPTPWVNRCPHEEKSCGCPPVPRRSVERVE